MDHSITDLYGCKFKCYYIHLVSRQGDSKSFGVKENLWGEALFFSYTGPRDETWLLGFGCRYPSLLSPFTPVLLFEKGVSCCSGWPRILCS